MALKKIKNINRTVNINKLFVLTLVLLTVGTSIVASAAESYECKNGKQTRKVFLNFPEAGKKAPCEVKYQKDAESEAEIKWSAKNEADYCEKKIQEFTEKLKGLGWNCEAGK